MIYTGEWPLSPGAEAVLRQVAERAAARGSAWAGVEDLAAVLQGVDAPREVRQARVDAAAGANVRANKRLEKVIELAADGWGLGVEGLKSGLSK